MGVDTPGSAAARTERFRPSRCGVINLWDYRDEEFVFADGRLVLRGPNGSGKTKALEVLFPFVLDARIEPRRLNPFAGDERTMKSNLLYRGQESAYGYVWMEFRRETVGVPDDGTGEAPAAEVVTIGAGLRAQRHHDRVTRWYFVVDGQVGTDFSLIGPDDRPLTRRQLTAEVEQLPAVLTERPSDHRAAVDTRLFGLGLGRFEQLITLLLTLRRPQLAKNLDPKGLSRALAEGLRPLDEGLIDEAAHSFSDMETVQRTLAGLIQADAAATTFLTGYTTYLRTHARAEADRLTDRLGAVRQSHGRLAAAVTEQTRSEAARDAAQQELDRQRERLRDIGSRLESWKASPAYRDREQLSRLAEVTEQLGRAATQAAGVRDRAQADVARRQQVHSAAGEAHRAALAVVTRRGTELAGAARDAGIEWGVDDGADGPVDGTDDGRFRERVSARVIARQDDIAAVRAAIADVAGAGHLRDQTQRRLDRTQERLDAAEQALAAAESAVDTRRAELAARLTAWLAEHADLFDRLAGVPDRGADRSESAAAPAADLRGVVEAALTTAADRVGDVEAQPLGAVLDDAVAVRRQAARDEIARLRALLAELTARLDTQRAERARIADERDQAPPPFAARTASRVDRPGAALWALVDFAPEVDDATAAALEAALEAANLLDAWVPPRSSSTPAHRTPCWWPCPPIGARTGPCWGPT